MDKQAVVDSIKDYDKQTFNSQAEIDAFMANNPEIFKWFYPKDNTYSDNLLKSDLDVASTTTLRFTDLMPGTKIKLVFAENGNAYSADAETIIIGATGSYYADDLRPVYGIYFVKDSGNASNFPSSFDGAIAYQYQVPVRNSFDSIGETLTDVGAYKQYVGEVKDVVADLSSSRDSVTKICMSRYFKRPVEYLYYQGELDYTEDAYEIGYNNNYRGLVSNYRDKLFWEASTYETNKFDEKEHLEYSPFSIYVLQSFIVNVNGVKENIADHMFDEISKDSSDTATEIRHRIDHLFERYYIDRYLFAQTAEEKLTERLALIERIKKIEDDTERQAYLDALGADPMYVFDPWIGKVYIVGENYNYNPTITYNNEQIDLREILRYDLDNLVPEDSKIAIGNGVYGDIYYHRVIQKYGFENNTENLRYVDPDTKEIKDAGSIKTAKEAYENYVEKLSAQPSRAELDELDRLYNKYTFVLELQKTYWSMSKSEIDAYLKKQQEE